VDELARAREIARVIAYCSEYLAPRLTYLQGNALALPAEFSQAVVVALSHLRRAELSADEACFRAETANALTLLEHACVACTRLVLEFEEARLDDLIKGARFHHAFVSPSIQRKYKDIKSRRRLYRRGPVLAATGSLQVLDALQADMLRLMHEVREQFPEAEYRMTRFRRWL
jgi:hypothetical protein